MTDWWRCLYRRTDDGIQAYDMWIDRRVDGQIAIDDISAEGSIAIKKELGH